MTRRYLVPAGTILAGLVLAGPADAQTPWDPSPSPGPVPSPPDVAPAVPTPSGSGPLGWLDPAEVVAEAVSRWVGELVDSALQQVWALLSGSLLVNPEVTSVPRVGELWRLSLGVVDATFVLAVLVGGIYVMNHETVQTRYGLGDILPRLVAAGLAANLNLLLIQPALQLGNAVSLALTGPNAAAGVGALRDALLGAIGGLGGNVFAQLAAGAVALMGLLLALTYVIRVAVLVVLVVGAPIALACHAVPALDGAARLWWRALAACLAIPIVQALVLSTAVQVWASEDGLGLLGITDPSALVTLLVVGCLLWVLARVPVWAARQVATPRSGLLVATLKYHVVGRSLRHATGAHAAHSHRAPSAKPRPTRPTRAAAGSER